MSDNMNNSLSVPQVLIVDDEPLVCELLRRWLIAEGYQCAEAANAAEARAHLQSHEVELVITDINMPGEAGSDLLMYIKCEFPDTAVMILTGLGEAQMAVQTLTRGAFGYLIKPVAREELVFQVRQGLERRQVALDKRIHLHDLERRFEQQAEVIRLAYEDTVHRLINVTMCRDEETGAHIRRTGLFSEVLARAAGWSPAEAARIRMAAPMHDIGKIGIPDAILRKPGQLTGDEYEVMKQHTVLGARLLAGSASPELQLAHEIALSHHEWWNGAGYPSGLSGDAIPEAARIVSIVDVYDALTHDRVYRPALPTDKVLRLLQAGQGTQFDPGLLSLFFSVLETIERIAANHPDPLADAPPALGLPEMASPRDLSLAMGPAQ